MRTGASGVCSMGGLTPDCNSAELRFWRGDEQIFKDNIKACLANNIYMICNLDFHKDISGGHYPFDPNRINDMLTIMDQGGCNRENSRITIENEPMKYWSKEEYAVMVNSSHNSIAGRWDMGAGNEEFGLSAAKGNMYYHILENCNFEYLDIHIQSTMIGDDWRVIQSRVHHWLNQARVWASDYNKRLSCTEANWSKIETAIGHADLMWERDQAKLYGCEDFNIVFIDGLTTTKHWLDYQINGNQNSVYWPDLKQRMIDEIIPINDEGRDGMIVETIGPLEQDIDYGNRVTLLHQVLVATNNMDAEDIDKYYQFDAATEAAVRFFQESLKVTMPWITVDGRIGRQTWDLLFKTVTDTLERNEFRETFKLYNSPIDKKGNV